MSSIVVQGQPIPRQQEFLPLLQEFVRLLRPKSYMEIGVKHGYTFNRIAPMVETAIAVDINGMEAIRELPHVIKHHCTSDELAAKWKTFGCPIDFLFIDADHRKESVLRDFRNFAPSVTPQGLIFLHDTHPMCEELLDDGYCSNAWEAAAELSFNPTYRISYEIVTIPGPFFGLSILRKIQGHYLYWRGNVSGKGKTD